MVVPSSVNSQLVTFLNDHCSCTVKIYLDRAEIYRPNVHRIMPIRRPIRHAEFEISAVSIFK